MTTISDKISITASFCERNNYFSIYKINGAKFAIFNTKISVDKNISIKLDDYNIVLLAPLKTNEDISIKALSIIGFSSINAENGKITLDVDSGKIFLLGDVGIQARKDMILEEFEKGLINKHPPTIVNALVETFDVITSPQGDHEYIDMTKAFDFLNIPMKTPNGKN